MIRLSAFAVIVAAASSTALAAPFEPLVVSTEAKFVAFADMEAGKKTALGDWMMQRLQENPNYQSFEQIMIDAAGFMPASDITDITIYGEKYGDNPEATLVIHANMDTTKLGQALGFAKGFESETYKAHTLMSWIDEEKNKRIHATFADERTILMTSNIERLKNALDVATDPTKAMHDDSPLPKQTQKEAWAFASGIDLGSSPAVMNNDVLDGILERAVMQMSEKDGKSILSLTVETETPEQAQHALSAANGLKAILQMAANRRRVPVPERAKLVAELASSTTTQVQGNNVSVTLMLDNDRATQVLEKLAELRDRAEK